MHGPVEVVDEEGNTIQTHTGPFRIASHGLKLVRTSSSGDVAALTARVGELEAQLENQVSAKESALSQLASVTEQLANLQTTIQEGADNEGDSGTPSVTTPIHGGVVSGGTQVSDNLRRRSHRDENFLQGRGGRILHHRQPAGRSGAALPDVRRDGVVVLTGRSPTGEPVTVRMLPELVLEVDGCEDCWQKSERGGAHMDDKVKKSADFILGNKAADLWLYTCDACATRRSYQSDTAIPRAPA